MEDRSPAQVYALVIGLALVAAGILGFFYSASFSAGDGTERDAVLGILDVNGWHNVVHIATGALGLLVASSYDASRAYALGFGAVYLLVALLGFLAGDGEEIFDLIPVNTEDNVLHLLIGIAGIGAGRRSRSTRSASVIARLLPLEPLLELLDRPVDQHLRGSLGTPHGARYLAVVHAEREAHDQGLAAVVGELRHPLEDLLHLLALLHHAFGLERGSQDRGVVQVRLRPPRAVAVVVRREVVGDADQPRPERSAVGLPLGALEVAIGLEEGLLRDVLGVVMVADPVVGVAVDVAEVRSVDLRELAVESLLVDCLLHPSSQPTPARPRGSCDASACCCGRPRASRPARPRRRAPGAAP